MPIKKRRKVERKRLRRSEKRAVYLAVREAWTEGERDPAKLEVIAKTKISPIISALLIELAIAFIRQLLESYFNKHQTPAASCPEAFLTDADVDD